MKRLAGGDGGTRQEAMFVLGRRVFPDMRKPELAFDPRH